MKTWGKILCGCRIHAKKASMKPGKQVRIKKKQKDAKTTPVSSLPCRIELIKKSSLVRLPEIKKQSDQ